MAAALALLTALCYGVSNFVGPLLSRDLPTYALIIAGQVVALTVSVAVVAASGSGVPGGEVWGAAALAGVGNAGGLILFYRAAATGPLSIVAPIGALAAVGPVAVGVAEGEGLAPAKVAGLVLALGGVALATRRSPEERAAAAGDGGVGPADEGGRMTAGGGGVGPADGGGRMTAGGGGVGPADGGGRMTAGGGGDVRAAAGLALASAASFGLFLIFMRPASEDGIFWAVALSRAALLAVVGAVAVLIAAPVRVPAARLGSVAIPGVLLFAGTLAYSAATQEGELSVVSVLGTLFPVVTILLAYTFLHERLSRSQAAGVLAAMTGAALMSLNV